MQDHVTQTTDNQFNFSLPGAVYAALPAGVIRIGYAMEGPGDARTPVASDQFRVTLPLRSEGDWVAHPLDKQLRDAHPGKMKLESIPVRVQFDDPGLVMRSRLEAYDPVSKRLVCASQGNGTALRRSSGGMAPVQCDGCNKCAFANQYGPESICRPLGRLSVQIDGQDDPFDHFVLRTGSYHSQRNLEAKLWQFKAMFGGLRGLPMSLSLRPMQSELSAWETFFVLDLKLGASPAQCKESVDKQRQDDQTCPVNLKSYEEAVRAGLRNGGVFGEVEPEAGFELSEFGFVDASLYRSDPVASVTLEGLASGHAAATAVLSDLAQKPVAATQAVATPSLPVSAQQPTGTTAEDIFDQMDALTAMSSQASFVATKAAKVRSDREQSRPVVERLGTFSSTRDGTELPELGFGFPMSAGGLQAPDFGG